MGGKREATVNDEIKVAFNEFVRVVNHEIRHRPGLNGETVFRIKWKDGRVHAIGTNVDDNRLMSRLLTGQPKT